MLLFLSSFILVFFIFHAEFPILKAEVSILGEYILYLSKIFSHNFISGKEVFKNYIILVVDMREKILGVNREYYTKN